MTGYCYHAHCTDGTRRYPEDKSCAQDTELRHARSNIHSSQSGSRISALKDEEPETGRDEASWPRLHK